MMPGKVIPISEARRRLPAKVKAKVRKPQSELWQRVTVWWTTRTTNGIVLLIGVMAGLVLGIVANSVVAARLARQAAVAAQASPARTPGPAALLDYSEGP